jgi:hypothetical protein
VTTCEQAKVANAYETGGQDVQQERVAKFIAAVASHFWAGMTLAWIETNGQASVLMSRDGVPVALATVDASAEGIDKIMWIMRPSKLAAILKSRERLRERELAAG